MLQRFPLHGKRGWPFALLILLCVAPLYGEPPAANPPLRHAPSRPPGEGWTSGPLVDANAPRRTPWDHPYADVEAVDSMNNLRYGNLDALGGYGWIGGFGLGWAWGGGFGFGYNTGWGGLPY